MDSTPSAPAPQDYIAYVTATCKARLGDMFAHEIRDATASTLARAWEKRLQFDPRLGSYKSWIAQIARTTCASIKRTAASKGYIPIRYTPDYATDDKSQPPPIDSMLHRERRRIVLHYAEHLPPAMNKAVVVMMAGHTHHEACHKLGVTYAAYQQSLSQGRARIAKMVATVHA